LNPILRIRNLGVEYGGPNGPVRVVDGVGFDLMAGETYALVGESGCGKTATALSILKLVEPGRITGGTVEFQGRDLVPLSDREMQKVRGGQIGMVFQEAAAALNPVMKIGAQVSEAIRIHSKASKKEAWAESVRLLSEVALPDPARQAQAYPHELSGGMKQRVMMAIALSCSPSLLIADEPTTALDVTIQAQILALLRDLRDRLGLTILLVTHDLGVVAENAHRMGVMYAGRLVEEGPVEKLFREPAHPYTRGLLDARPLQGAGDEGPAGRLPVLEGSVPDPSCYPSGCRFHPRCPERLPRCDGEQPVTARYGDDRRVACFLHDGEGQSE
jgi:oligopeptide/dipeptide ABC transporter ATP-binding protein